MERDARRTVSGRPSGGHRVPQPWSLKAPEASSRLHPPGISGTRPGKTQPGPYAFTLDYMFEAPEYPKNNNKKMHGGAYPIRAAHPQKPAGRKRRPRRGGPRGAPAKPGCERAYTGERRARARRPPGARHNAQTKRATARRRGTPGGRGRAEERSLVHGRPAPGGPRGGAGRRRARVRSDPSVDCACGCGRAWPGRAARRGARPPG